MEKKERQTVSVAALIISILPLMTFIPVFLQITLPDGLRTTWAGANIICVLLGLCLSIGCVKNRKSRSAINIASTVISGVLLLMLLGIVALALFLNLVS